ncbi:MAG: electron transfer flavoprotein subunit alpha/FixB family protein, partial [Candidatus Kapaibacteriota bacterium]
MEKILVYIESSDNKLKRVSYELITAGKKLADQTGAELWGVAFNANEISLQTAKEFGLSKVFNIESSLFKDYSISIYSKALSLLIKDKKFDLIIFPAHTYGFELAGRISANLGCAYVSDCIALEINESNLIAKKPVYAGKAQITVKLNTDVKICSLRPNVFTAQPAPVSDLLIEKFSPNLNEDDRKEKVVNVIKNEGKLDVLEADIIVSGGRGVKGPENYYLIENLANTLGAAVGASRAVVDAGWRPHSEQVGQTGKT